MMKRRVFICLAVLSVGGEGGVVLASAPEPFARENLAAHVRFLSSNELGGREAGSEGECRAADYVASEFAEIGLSPLPARMKPGTGPEDSVGAAGPFIHPFVIFKTRAGDTIDVRFESDSKGVEPRSPSAMMSNVLGAVDPERPGKALVIGAHYDHLGTRDGAIYPGADDNASGVAVLIEIARAYAAENPWNGPVIFAAFTGEEKGALGSRDYVCEPPIPLQETAAMVNIDMVGRLGEGKLLFAAEGLADSAREAFGRAAGSDPPLSEMRSGYEAGDLAPFAEARVPSLLLFTGPHADYHHPSDTEDKIDYEGLGRVGRFAARVAPLFARFAAGGFAGSAPKVSVPSPTGEDRPFLGTVPDFTAEGGEGVLVAGVVPGSPAEAAGVRAGDRVVGLGGSPIADLREYSAALRRWKPGDRVALTVRRGGETLALEATLMKRAEEPNGSGGGHPGGGRPHP